MPRRKLLPPVHPGEISRGEFLAPPGITQYRLARDTSVLPRRINEIVRGARATIADTALRLARYFGTSEPFWLNLQTRPGARTTCFSRQRPPSVFPGVHGIQCGRRC